MIYTGIDLIEIARLQRAVERWGVRFLQRVFTAGELHDCGLSDNDDTTMCVGNLSYASLAGRWAAKEAASKALGVGIRGLTARRGVASECSSVAWTDLEVVRGHYGQPFLQLHGRAFHAAAALGLQHLAVSMSHTRDHAIANVVGVVVEISR